MRPRYTVVVREPIDARVGSAPGIAVMFGAVFGTTTVGDPVNDEGSAGAPVGAAPGELPPPAAATPANEATDEATSTVTKTIAPMRVNHRAFDRRALSPGPFRASACTTAQSGGAFITERYLSSEGLRNSSPRRWLARGFES